MNYEEQKMVGGARRLVRNGLIFTLLAVILAAGGLASAQEMYKYRGPDGEWIYSDRPPDDDSLVEIRQIESNSAPEAGIRVTHEFEGRTVELVAHNQSYVPVELTVTIKTIRGMEFPDPDLELKWTVPPREDFALLSLDLLEDGSTPFLEYQYRYLAGDPAARHRPQFAYRVPYAVATEHPVTQAYPNIATHTTPDSYYAVDVAMPIGTDIMAARGGVVFDTAASNFRGGLDPVRDGPAANVIRILHDDGTYAIYAHLNTNSIRVRPGDRVQRGQYIADSGNTGFSTGPHLHFVVVRNVGMDIESLPVTFMGQNAASVVPASGMPLTAY
jgi:murein DD-endopeptidase MepM/ murein hydrolase activator NlpD